MIIKSAPVYLCSSDNLKLFKIESLITIAEHFTGYYKNRLVIIPKKIKSNTINPKNLLLIKNELKISKLLLVDKIKGADEAVIIDHVNISGQNFLRANTPHGDLPQFPDMSKVYNVMEGHIKVVVHTVGPDRFKEARSGEHIISEAVGLIAPVVHYVGVKVFALGSNNIEKSINTL